MSIYKTLILSLLIVFASAKAWSQATSSPYTTFGIGEPYGNALIHNQGMGGIGVSQPQFWFINNQNPALLVYNTLTVFQAGVVAESRTLRGDTLNEKVRGGNMNYLVVAFPVKFAKWTTSLGLMPYTNVDYGFQYVKDLADGENGRAIEEESGSGGLTQLYWSNGVRLTRGLSVGLKASYLFGPITNLTTTQKEGTPFINSIEEKSSAADFNFGVGLAYSRDSLWGKNYRLSFGGVYSFATDLNAKRSTNYFTTNPLGDTLLDNSLGKIHASVPLPASLTLGVSLSRGLKWNVGTEFFLQDWSEFKGISVDNEGLGKSWRFALGGEFTPEPQGYGSYLKKLTYRTGLSLEQYPFLANGTEVKDFGINFGLSLPAGRSSVDLAFKFGKRGDKSENLLEESYFKIYFGITFNDQWFIKRKFD